jgi:hypothetical protein
MRFGLGKGSHDVARMIIANFGSEGRQNEPWAKVRGLEQQAKGVILCSFLHTTDRSQTPFCGAQPCAHWRCRQGKTQHTPLTTIHS